MLALLIPLYAIADRFAGGGAPRLDARLPGRALLWATLLAAAASYLIAGWPAVVLALAWGLHRSLPFRLFGGSAAPETMAEGFGTFLRYLLLLIPAALIAQVWDLPILRTVALMTVFAALATVLAVWYGEQAAEARARRQHIGNQNVWVELIRGAAFGAIAWGVLS